MSQFSAELRSGDREYCFSRRALGWIKRRHKQDFCLALLKLEGESSPMGSKHPPQELSKRSGRVAWQEPKRRHAASKRTLSSDAPQKGSLDARRKRELKRDHTGHKRRRLAADGGAFAGATRALEAPAARQRNNNSRNASGTSGLSEDYETETSLVDLDPVAAHQQELVNLQKQDPEFYAYLRSHDDALLRFGESEASKATVADGNASSSAESDQASAASDASSSASGPADHATSDTYEAHRLDALEQSATRPTRHDAKRLRLDVSWIQRIRRELMRPSKRIAALRRLVSVLSHLVRERDVPAGNSDQARIGSFADADARHRVMLFAIVAVPAVLQRHLGAKLRDLDPNDPEWQRYRRLMLSYGMCFSSLFALVRDPLTKCYLIRRIEKLAHFLPLLPKWSKTLIRDLTIIWARPEELVMIRSQVHATLRALLGNVQPCIAQVVLRECYRTFTQTFKSRNPRTAASMDFCLQSARELFAESGDASYRVAFGEVQELGFQVRKALSSGRGCDCEAILNWSFIHAVEWWSHVLAVHEQLASLRFPYLQIVLILIDGLRSARLFGARFACIRALLRLAGEVHSYVPLCASLLEMLGQVECDRTTKGAARREVPVIDWPRLLRIQDAVLQSSNFGEAVVDEVVYSLLNWLTLYVRESAFPELAFPIQKQLIRLLRSSKSRFLRERLVVLVARLKDDIAAISNWRQANDVGAAMKVPNFVVIRLEQLLAAEREKRARVQPTGIIIPEPDSMASESPAAHTEEQPRDHLRVTDELLAQTDDILLEFHLDEDGETEPDAMAIDTKANVHLS